MMTTRDEERLISKTSSCRYQSQLKLSSVELCTGAGGLALGTDEGGFNPIAVIDLDHACCETLKLNKENNVSRVRDWEIIESDITDLNFSLYADVDLLSGGPPCQPFSQGGKRSGRSDERDMFPQFIRAINECRPKSFIIENVKGLLHSSFRNYFNYLTLRLTFPDVERKKGEKWVEHRARLERLFTSGRHEGLRYNVVSQVLNAADFGVAQGRYRVFIVGIRDDLGIEYSFPLPTHSREALWIDQWVTGAYWARHRISKRRRPSVPKYVAAKLKSLGASGTHAWKTVRDVISDLPNVGLGRTSHKVTNHFLNPGARVYEGHGGSSLDLPSKTIKAGHNGVPGGENIIRLDDGSVRYYSVRECARLQAFPDEWIFDGSWCCCMRQVGNAVPVTLGKIVASPLASALQTKLRPVPSRLM